MRELLLNKDWRLHEAPLDWTRERLSRVMAFSEGWLGCDLPCDVHMPLIAAGIIRDPVLADYCFESEWIEKRSWWFVKRFSGADVDLDADALELTLESLDARSDVFLNGEWLGEHRNAHDPFVRGVKGRVLPGENVLAVRITTGLEEVTDGELADINWAVCTEDGNGCPERGDKRRAFVRRPQYTVGWDWGPKCLTCGIVKDVYLRAYRKTAVRGAHMVTKELRGGDALLGLEIEIDQLDVVGTRDADVRVSLSLNGEVRVSVEARDRLLVSGLNYVNLPIELKDAKLWWPAGSGDQPLYKVEITVETEGETEAYPAFLYGVRTVALDTRRTGESTRAFSLVVNGVPLFCKGGDWIPADSVYARVTDQKYETLVSEAAQAGFNMLRVWGGGVYERDSFFEACDRHGILLWHDFMLACSAYPDHLAWFRREVEEEQTYQVRRLRNHPCMAIWCGNNENHWIFFNPRWGIDIRYEKQYGLYASNEISMRVLHAHAPEMPYWNSSPYGGKLPGDEGVGDTHHWGECMMNKDMALRIEPKEYDKVRSRFVTEYGYPGPCAIASIRQYLDGGEIDRSGKVWDLHNNTFEKKTVNAGIEKQYAVDAGKLSLSEYLLYAGMVQSLMLEYSLEAIRFKDFCGGALFWMYNDTWGEVGWTIIDYYLRRKISFYGVKRAFAPVKLSLREAGGKVRVQGLNDTDRALSFDAMAGYLSFDGAISDLKRIRVDMKPRSREYLFDAAMPGQDMRRGTYVILPEGEVEPAALRLYDTRELILPRAEIRAERAAEEDGNQVLTLTAEAYVHGAYIDTDLPCSDNYFNLLPGQKKRVTVYGAKDAELNVKSVMD